MLHVLSSMPTPQFTNPSLAEVRVMAVCFNSIFFMLMRHVSYSTDREIFVVSNRSIEPIDQDRGHYCQKEKITLTTKLLLVTLQTKSTLIDISPGTSTGHLRCISAKSKRKNP